MKRRWTACIAMVAIAVLTGALGVWQIERGREKDGLQAGREAARLAEPVAPGGALPSLSGLDGRRVVLVGRFDEAHTVFLDNRTRSGVAGFHVLTPLRLDDGGAWVPVLRGWVARDISDRSRVPTLHALGGTVRIEGFAQAVLAQPIVLAAQPDPGRGERILQHYAPEMYRRWSGVPVVEGIVRQTSETPDGLARDWVEPGSGADKHRAYAFQWLLMAFLAAAGAVVVAWRTLRRPDAA